MSKLKMTPTVNLPLSRFHQLRNLSNKFYFSLLYDNKSWCEIPRSLVDNYFRSRTYPFRRGNQELHTYQTRDRGVKLTRKRQHVISMLVLKVSDVAYLAKCQGEVGRRRVSTQYGSRSYTLDPGAGGRRGAKTRNKLDSVNKITAERRIPRP
jgi:hypothetical protein